MRLVFDLGGVVYRWQPHEFLPRMLPARAPDRGAAERFAAAFFQSFDGDWSEFDRGTLEAEELARRTAERLGLGLHEARHVIASIPAELQPVPETVALIERLRADGHELRFLSNMPHPYAEVLEARDPVMRLFAGGVFSSRVGLIKPEPALFAHAAAAFGGDARDLLLLDDVERNVVAARAAGWQAIRFDDAAQCAAAIADHGFAPRPSAGA
jgi:putative hydrolase of the HAD superfamily